MSSNPKRPANSFGADEIGVAQTILRKVMSDPNYRVIIRGPAFAGLSRKFASMAKRIEIGMDVVNDDKESA